uniref:RING-CH-type domain-containing protein n=1 Tax=Timema monikensis TaxID=170555 RepID=A0A7R9E9R8_9NEOP|nr:unnamed protein product [Timema monikensis]
MIRGANNKSPLDCYINGVSPYVVCSSPTTRCSTDVLYILNYEFEIKISFTSYNLQLPAWVISRLRSSHEFELAGGSLRDHNIIRGNIFRSRDPEGYAKSLSTVAIPPLPSVGSNYCRYCQTTDDNSEKLIMPCRCQGTMAFVHLSCLTRWLNSVGRTYCELCLTRFKTETKRRFKLFESLVIWAQHPVNRIRVRTNLAIISLLAVFTGAMLTLGLMGIKHFINKDSPLSQTQVRLDPNKSEEFLGRPKSLTISFNSLKALIKFLRFSYQSHLASPRFYWEGLVQVFMGHEVRATGQYPSASNVRVSRDVRLAAISPSTRDSMDRCQQGANENTICEGHYTKLAVFRTLRNQKSNTEKGVQTRML